MNQSKFTPNPVYYYSPIRRGFMKIGNGEYKDTRSPKGRCQKKKQDFMGIYPTLANPLPVSVLPRYTFQLLIYLNFDSLKNTNHIARSTILLWHLNKHWLSQLIFIVSYLKQGCKMFLAESFWFQSLTTSYQIKYLTIIPLGEASTHQNG